MKGMEQEGGERRGEEGREGEGGRQGGREGQGGEDPDPLKFSDRSPPLHILIAYTALCGFPFVDFIPLA
jgi:hypothetical protein